MKNPSTRHELHPQAGKYLSFLLVIAAFPFFGYLPTWITFLFFAFVGWRLFADRRGWQMPSKLIQTPILIAASGYLFYTMSSQDFSSLESFVAWLVTLGVFKLLETAKARDVRILVLMVWLIAGCLQLVDQTTTHLLLGIAISLFGTITLRALYDPEDQTNGFFSATSGVLRLFALGLPIGLVIFVVFPRFSVRALGLGLDPKSGTGFSEDVEPGSVTELAQSDEVVMRVTFPGEQVLQMSNFYWRGSVLNSSEGLTWRKTIVPRQWTPTRDRGGIEQIITLEPQRGRWLFSLDRPNFAEWITEVPRASLYTDDQAVLAPSREVSNRVVYRVFSRIGTYQSEDKLDRWIEISEPDRWPRAQKFATELKAKHKSADDFARAMLSYFQDKGFTYTLAPGAIPDNSLDFFLFQGKRGFCEHYAAASATLFRMAGIPARVVVGFQGGVYNAIGGFFQVRNKDAHAWVEYYSTQKGWVRYDPVQSIAPDRIMGGADQFFGNRQDQFALGLLSGVFTRGSWMLKQWYTIRQAMEALDFTISRFLLDFDFSMQAQLFNLGKNSWVILSLVTLVMLLVGFFVLRLISNRRGRQRDPMLELYHEARNKLDELGIKTEDWHAAQSVGEIVKQNQSTIERADEWQSWLQEWQQHRYGRTPNVDWLTFRDLRRKLHAL